MVKFTRVVEINVDKNVTQCAICDVGKSQCHLGCVFENDLDKKNCVAMDPNTSICKNCGCSWYKHINAKVIFKEIVEDIDISEKL